MEHGSKSIRPFIGAKDFENSRSFYTDLGFKEVVLANNFSYFESGNVGFYLQDYYVKDWIDNTMIFMEVNNVSEFFNQLEQLDLPGKYKEVKLVPIKNLDWGRECFVHDPSGVLWHFGEFYNKS
jgi:catechol 2,3-dioxygenase-like lactoylglutathione lyase family enzyme